MKTIPIYLILVLSSIHASARIWTSSDGRTVDAEFVKADDKNVTIKKGAQEFTLPLDKISQADRDFVSSKKSEGSTAATGGTAAAALKVTDAIKLEPAFAAAISPDAKTIATGHNEKLSLWDAGSGKRLTELKLKITIEKMAFSEDGQFLAGGSASEGLVVVDVRARRTTATINFSEPGKPLMGDVVNKPLGFTSDGKSVIVGRNKDIAILGLPGGKVVKSIPVTTKDNDKFDYVLLPGANEVVTLGQYDGKLSAWDLKTGQPSTRQFQLASGTVAPINASLAVACADKIAVRGFSQLLLFDCGTGAQLQPVRNDTLEDFRKGKNPGFSKDGKVFAEGTWDSLGENFVNLYDASTGTSLTRIGPFDKETVFAAASVSADVKILMAVPIAVGENPTPVLVWRLK